MINSAAAPAVAFNYEPYAALREARPHRTASSFCWRRASSRVEGCVAVRVSSACATVTHTLNSAAVCWCLC